MHGTAGALRVPSPSAERLHVPAQRDILGVNVEVLSKERALADIAKAIAERHHARFAFLNAHGANLACRDANYRETLRRFTVLADGIGVDIASRLLYGAKFPDNLNGTDFIPALLGHVSGCRVGLLGARDGVAEKAAGELRSRFPQNEFVTIGHGYFPESQERQVLAKAAAAQLDILLIAFGNPHQEQWIARHCAGEHATVVIGVGALFDFMAGIVPRAPALLRHLRMEWIFRLALEPKRLWRRYVLGNPVFLLRVLRQRMKQGLQRG